MNRSVGPDDFVAFFSDVVQPAVNEFDPHGACAIPSVTAANDPVSSRQASSPSGPGVVEERADSQPQYPDPLQ